MSLAPTIVFDLDGTLAETAGDLIGTLNYVLKREGVAPLSIESARFMLGAGARALITRGLANAGRTASPERLEEMFHDFLVHYEDHIAERSFLFDGADEALARFAAQGWILAVCTNKIERPARKLLEILGVSRRFATIAGQDTFKVCKPDPEALRQTILAAGGSPARAIMVGDSFTDIKTAQSAGIPSVGVTFGYTDRPVQEFGPTRVITHFSQLWDAAASIEAERGNEARVPATSVLAKSVVT